MSDAMLKYVKGEIARNLDPFRVPADKILMIPGAHGKLSNSDSLGNSDAIGIPITWHMTAVFGLELTNNGYNEDEDLPDDDWNLCFRLVYVCGWHKGRNEPYHPSQDELGSAHQKAVQFLKHDGFQRSKQEPNLFFMHSDFYGHNTVEEMEKAEMEALKRAPREYVDSLLDEMERERSTWTTN